MCARCLHFERHMFSGLIVQRFTAMLFWSAIAVFNDSILPNSLLLVCIRVSAVVSVVQADILLPSTLVGCI